jgi:hypothetical protein
MNYAIKTKSLDPMDLKLLPNVDSSGKAPRLERFTLMIDQEPILRSRVMYTPVLQNQTIVRYKKRNSYLSKNTLVGVVVVNSALRFDFENKVAERHIAECQVAKRHIVEHIVETTYCRFLKCRHSFGLFFLVKIIAFHIFQILMLCRLRLWARPKKNSLDDSPAGCSIGPDWILKTRMFFLLL